MPLVVIATMTGIRRVAVASWRGFRPMVVMISLLLTEPARGVQALVLGLQNWYWSVQARARKCQV